MKKAVIVRIDKKYAVCILENGMRLNIDKDKVPANAKENDTILLDSL